MIAAVHKRYLPNKIFAYADSSFLDKKELLPVLEGKISSDGQAKIFVCENYACQRPFLIKEDFENFYRSLISSNNNYRVKHEFDSSR